MGLLSTFWNTKVCRPTAAVRSVISKRRVYEDQNRQKTKVKDLSMLVMAKKGVTPFFVCGRMPNSLGVNVGRNSLGPLATFWDITAVCDQQP